MPEQFELDFGEAKNEPKETDEEELRRLAKEYQKIFGPNPINRGFDKTTIVNGLAHPDEEQKRLWEMDKESDEQDIRNTYKR